MEHPIIKVNMKILNIKNKWLGKTVWDKRNLAWVLKLINSKKQCRIMAKMRDWIVNKTWAISMITKFL